MFWELGSGSYHDLGSGSHLNSFILLWLFANNKYGLVESAPTETPFVAVEYWVLVMRSRCQVIGCDDSFQGRSWYLSWNSLTTNTLYSKRYPGGTGTNFLTHSVIFNSSKIISKYYAEINTIEWIWCSGSRMSFD